MRICRISASTAPVSKLIKQVQVQKNKIDDGSQNLQNPDENREKYEQNQCIGITRGGRNTKIHAVVDGIGYPIHIQLSSGNISDVSIAQEVLSHVNLDGTIVMGDKVISTVPSAKSGVMPSALAGGCCSLFLQSSTAISPPPSRHCTPGMAAHPSPVRSSAWCWPL